MGEWIAFWDSEHSIYVNARHRDVHYRTVADNIRNSIEGQTSLARQQGRAVGEPVVLDYGCGEALHADLVAADVGRLLLCEAAPKVRAALGVHFAGNPKIAVRSPQEIAALPERSVDFIVLHSVAQYMTAAELAGQLAVFRRLLKPQGCLFLGDIIPPDLPASTDALALLRFARANGFLGAAVIGLLRTLLSDYWRLRTQLGLTRYSEAAMIDKLAAAGFSATRAPANIGHNQARMTFIARRA